MTKLNNPQIELDPSEFEKYQRQISTFGICPIRFNLITFDMVKVETNMAILIKTNNQVCWVPKSCIYNFQEKDGKCSLYLREGFELRWEIDSREMY